MSVYDLLDWPEYHGMQMIKEFFWKEFSFEQKLLQSFGLLHVDTEGIREPGNLEHDEILRFFIFEEGVLFIMNSYYHSGISDPSSALTKIRWIEVAQSEELGRYAPYLKHIEEMAETRPFEWIGEPKPWNERDWHQKTIVGMQVTQQQFVRDDLACYAFPAVELPEESRAGASQELWGLSLQFSLQGYSAYFAIEPLQRGYHGGDKFEHIAQDPAWYWSRQGEFYREARLREYDGCMMQIIPGTRPLYSKAGSALCMVSKPMT
jgi:hypothetical protein